MITFTVFKDSDNIYRAFSSTGHAKFAKFGKDIVCSAVSVLVINTINSIEVFAEDEVSLMSDEESGMISYHLTKNPSKEAGLLLNSMILGLQNMVDDENYAEYIDLTFEEV